MKTRCLPGMLLIAVLLLIPVRAAWAGDMQGALRYVPNDSFAVIGADMDQVRKLSVYHRFTSLLMKESGPRRDIDQVRQAVGFDPIKDVRSVVVALPQAFLQDDDEVVLIVEAPFKEKTFAAYVNKQGLKAQKKTSQYGPYWDIDNGDAALAYRGKYLIVGGPKAFMAALAAGSGPSNMRRGKMLAALQNVNQSKAMFMVSEIPPQLQQKLRQELKEAGDIRDVSGSLAVPGGGLKLNLLATCGSNKGASSLEMIINGMLQKGREDGELKQLGLDTYLSQIKVKAQGRMVTIDVNLTRAQVDALASKMSKL